MGNHIVPVSTNEQVGQYYAGWMLFFHSGISRYVLERLKGREVEVGPHCHCFNTGNYFLRSELEAAKALTRLSDRLFYHVQFYDIGLLQGTRVSRAEV